jgi:tetratricopeptide (TPR) repeat protein
MNAQALANQALQHHRQGNLGEAERLYRAALKGDGRNAMLLYMLGIALAQQGKSREALPFLDQSLAFHPRMPDALFARAQLLLLLSRPADALADIEQGLLLSPGNPAMLMAHGHALSELGRFETAVQSYDRALALAPANPEALNNRGNALRQLGRLAEALESYERALRLKPDYFDVLHNRAGLLRQLGRFEAALANYDAALRLQPASLDASTGRARTLRDLGRMDEALAGYRQAQALAPESDEAATGLAELLYARGAVDEAFQMFRARAERTHPDGVPMPEPSSHPPHRAKHDREQAAHLAGLLGRAPDSLSFYLDAGARVPDGAVNAQIPREDIQHQWKTARPQIVVVDNLLTPQALAALRRFCQASTIWHKSYDAGYLGTTPESGFACPLLAQIAEEFPRVLPEIFRAYPLKYLWAFKYDSSLAGINLHADFAAVNVNFWITPDEANLDPEGGGLLVWDKAAPLDWNFEKYNSDEKAMRRFLEQAGARPVTIPYRANRAVIFDSDLFHETDKISFQEGYRNRRINVTLLYGEREAQAGAVP